MILMRQWSITLHGPAGILSAVETGESQFVIATETASDVFTVVGEGVVASHAWVWICDPGMQVQDLERAHACGGDQDGRSGCGFTHSKWQEFDFGPFPQLARAVSSRGAPNSAHQITARHACRIPRAH